MSSTTLLVTRIRDHRSLRTDPMGGSASRHPFATPMTTEARPNTYDSYSMMPAPEPISLWVKDIRCSQLSCTHDLAMVHSPLFTPFDNAFSSMGNRINPLSTKLYTNWGTRSSKAKCYSSATSLRNSSKPDKKSLMPAPKSDMRSRSRYWPAPPLPLPDRLWTPPPNVSSRPEPTAPSIHFYFTRPFGMSATTRQWSTRENIFTASYKWEDDCHHRVLPTRILRPPTSPTF